MPQEASGTSVLVRSLCGYLRREGIKVHLLIPSLRTFGRTPLNRISLSAADYDGIEICGGLRFGDRWLRLSPGTYLRAAREIGRRAVARLSGGRLFRAPSRSFWDTGMASAAERAAVAAAIRRLRPTAIVVNYYYLADVLDMPEAAGIPSFLIVHNVVFERRESFRRAGLPMPEDAIDREGELRCYAKAGALLAVQAAEAEILRAALPDRRVILMPVGFPLAPPRPDLQEPALCLFVGSRNPVNRDGLRWFCDAVWGRVRAARPDARLDVCGGVGQDFDAVPEGVTLRGLVEDLGEAYARATVCVVPLLAGSGLKIKLVEAMTHGCAIVTTSTGAQGLEHFADRAFLLRDDAAGMADAILGLFAEPERRAALQAGARDTARDHFSEEACYREFRDALVASPAD